MAAQVWKLPAEGGEEIQVLGSLLSYWYNFLPVEDGLYFGGWDEDGTNGVFFLDFASQEMTPICLTNTGFGISISPDRRWLLFDRQDRYEFDLMLAEGFR